MTGNLIDLRRRIKSVNNFQKITKAMKTVSAAKLRRTAGELKRIKSYLNRIETLLKTVYSKLKGDSHPLIVSRSEGTVVLVVVSSDKGLCGAFNAHIFRKVEAFYPQISESETKVELVPVGKKACQYLERKAYPIKKSYPSIMTRIQMTDASELSSYLQDLFLKEEIKNIQMMVTQFISASQQHVAVKQLFPLELEDKEGEEPEEKEFIFEPDPGTIFNQLLPKYIDSQMYQFLLESAASEHASRMVAMELATRNASDMIRSLTLTLNKLRQAAITKELLEIITATEALKK